MYINKGEVPILRLQEVSWTGQGYMGSCQVRKKPWHLSTGPGIPLTPFRYIYNLKARTFVGMNANLDVQMREPFWFEKNKIL